MPIVVFAKFSFFALCLFAFLPLFFSLVNHWYYLLAFSNVIACLNGSLCIVLRWRLSNMWKWPRKSTWIVSFCQLIDMAYILRQIGNPTGDDIGSMLAWTCRPRSGFCKHWWCIWHTHPAIWHCRPVLAHGVSWRLLMTGCTAFVWLFLNGRWLLRGEN